MSTDQFVVVDLVGFDGGLLLTVTVQDLRDSITGASV